MIKKTKALLTIASVIALSGAALILNGRAVAQVANPRATLTFTAPASVTDGSTFTVDVLIDTPNLDSITERISGADVIVSYPASLLEVTSLHEAIDPGEYFAGGSILSPQVINNVAGTARFIVGSGTGNTKFGAGTIATITFHAVGTGDATITMDPASNGITATNINENVADNIFPAAVTIEAVGATVPKLKLTSPQSVFVVGDTVEVDLYADTQGNDVDGVDARIHFDPAILHANSVTAGSPSSFTQFPALKYNNTAGTIDVSANTGSDSSAPAANGNNMHLAHIVFTPIANGPTNIYFDFALGSSTDSNMVNRPVTGDPVDILEAIEDLTFNVSNPTPTPTATSTPTPTFTPTPTATPVLEQGVAVKVYLDGRGAGKNNAKNLTIHVQSATDVNDIQTFNVDSDTAGDAHINILPGNYILLVDANGYLGKKFGSTADPIVVALDTTIVDLSGSPLLAGDFNDDSTINEVDYSSYYITSIFSTSNTLVDIQGDGIVNSLDFAILRRNWNMVDDIL